jgi:hypothetical protein
MLAPTTTAPFLSNTLPETAPVEEVCENPVPTADENEASAHRNIVSLRARESLQAIEVNDFIFDLLECG